MRYVSAYLVASLGGEASPSVADLETILCSVRIETESDKISTIISEFKGKTVEELMALGSSKLASVLSGGAVAVAPAAAASDSKAAAPATAPDSKAAAPATAPDSKAAAPATAPVATKKGEKKEESEESDDDIDFGLFD